MEKIFQKLSLASASLVFVILIGIFITLFSASKEAISEFGLGFISNPNWNKEVPITSADTSKVQEVVSFDMADDKEDIADEDTILDEDEADGDEMLFDEDSASETITEYGGLVPIVGTLLTTIIALAFALPIAM
ncbi:MAG: hypothetical protein ABGW74_02160, partial [Campylobacterales bacterium]